MQSLSSERLPTLCKYLTTFERFYISWKKAGNDPNNPQFRPFVQEGLKWVEKYYNRMGDTKAYIIAMCTRPFDNLKSLELIYLFHCSVKSGLPPQMDQETLGTEGCRRRH